MHIIFALVSCLPCLENYHWESFAYFCIHFSNNQILLICADISAMLQIIQYFITAPAPQWLFTGLCIPCSNLKRNYFNKVLLASAICNPPNEILFKDAIKESMCAKVFVLSMKYAFHISSHFINIMQFVVCILCIVHIWFTK